MNSLKKTSQRTIRKKRHNSLALLIYYKLAYLYFMDDPTTLTTHILMDYSKLLHVPGTYSKGTGAYAKSNFIIN